MADAFSDSEWQTMLGGNVWLDGRAAFSLQKRGMGRYLGVRLEEDAAFYTSAEHYLDLPDWNGAAANRKNMAARRNPASVLRMESLGPEAIVLSAYVRWPAWGRPEEHERVGAAVTVFENSLGGKIMVYAGCLPATYDLHVVHPFRREQLLGVARWMDPAAFSFEVVSDGDLMILQGSHPELGELLYLLNLNLDPEPEILLRRNPLPGCRVEKLDSTSGWQTLHQEDRSGKMAIFHSFAHLEPVLLRFVPPNLPPH